MKTRNNIRIPSVAGHPIEGQREGKAREDEREA